MLDGSLRSDLAPEAIQAHPDHSGPPELFKFDSGLSKPDELLEIRGSNGGILM